MLFQLHNWSQYLATAKCQKVRSAQNLKSLLGKPNECTFLYLFCCYSTRRKGKWLLEHWGDAVFACLGWYPIALWGEEEAMLRTEACSLCSSSLKTGGHILAESCWSEGPWGCVWPELDKLLGMCNVNTAAEACSFKENKTRWKAQRQRVTLSTLQAVI